jgi:hypothetical protein
MYREREMVKHLKNRPKENYTNYVYKTVRKNDVSYHKRYGKGKERKGKYYGNGIESVNRTKLKELDAFQV